jgi:hypothetical protein
MGRYEATVTVQAQVSANVDIVLEPEGAQTVISVQDMTPVIVTDSQSARFRGITFDSGSTLRTERLKLRVQADFFNVFNVPGDGWNAGADGIAGAWTNTNPSGPRTTQLSARFTW